MVAWLVHISPPTGVSAQFTTSVLGSKLGRVELIRTVLAILTLAAALLFRSWKPALLAGSACLLLSAGIGHPAAIDPTWAIPAQAIHLLAGALWLGGLIWILTTARESDDVRQREALRVSSLALVAVIAVGLSGLLQAVLFLNSPGDLLRSGYGKLVVAKTVGLLILLAYGAYNRFSLLPRFANGGDLKLRTSVKQEVFLVSLLILIGGFLAYVPPPPASAASVSRGAQ